MSDHESPEDQNDHYHIWPLREEESGPENFYLVDHYSDVVETYGRNPDPSEYSHGYMAYDGKATAKQTLVDEAVWDRFVRDGSVRFKHRSLFSYPLAEWIGYINDAPRFGSQEMPPQLKFLSKGQGVVWRSIMLENRVEWDRGCQLVGFIRLNTQKIQLLSDRFA